MNGSCADYELRRHVAGLFSQGCSLAEIGTRLGVPRQAVYQMLHVKPRYRPLSRCGGCGASLTSVALPRHDRQALCLACLSASPRATFAERLTAYRLATGLPQGSLAVQAGLTPGTLCQLEQGTIGDPRLSQLLALAKALQISVGELIGEKTAEPGDGTESAQ